jgi:hypothetical protein
MSKSTVLFILAFVLLAALAAFGVLILVGVIR